MKRRVLVSAFEVPGFGGAATSAYALYAKMRRDGVDAHYANVIQSDDVPFLRHVYGEHFGNPDGIDGVADCIVDAPLFKRHDRLAAYVAAVRPDVIVARGYIAAWLLAQVTGGVPRVPIVYFVAGWPESSEVSEHRRTPGGPRLASRPLAAARSPTLVNPRHAETFAACDIAVACSPLTKALTERVLSPWLAASFYPEPLWAAEWIVEATTAAGAPQKPYAERSIDLLFLASAWQRWEKNLPLVRRIAGELPRLRIHVAGTCSKPLAGVTHHGLVADRRRVLELMGDAKAVVVPSLLDASPGVLFEASAMGANVIASTGCGNWQICNQALLVDPYSESGFIEACKRAVAERYPDRIDWFLEAHSYARLLEILAWI